MNINQLNEAIEKPELEREFQEVFDYVETITAQNFNIDALTQGDVEVWNQKFGDVLKKLLSMSV